MARKLEIQEHLKPMCIVINRYARIGHHEGYIVGSDKHPYGVKTDWYQERGRHRTIGLYERYNRGRVEETQSLTVDKRFAYIV